MKYYLKNLLALVSLQSKLFLEDRANAIGQFIIYTADLLVTIIFVQIYFSFTSNLFGWDKNQIFLISGLYKIFSSLFATFFYEGITRIPSYVKNGELDLFLTKPINAQFYVSLRYIAMPKILSSLSGIILVVFAVSNLNVALINYVLLVIGLLSGLVIFYSLYFTIATLAIYLQNFVSLGDIFYMMRNPLSVPIDILAKQMSFILTYVIPLGFVITVPAKVFLDKSPFYMSFLSIFFAGVFLYLSNWFWNFSLKHYTSASS